MRPPAAFRAFLGLFFLSGAAGLVYETVWMRWLEISLGAASYSVAVILSVFMGGLALGGWAGARRAPRLRRPLRGYAVLESAVGIYALVLPLLDPLLREALRPLSAALLDTPFLSLALRAATAILLLLPPTFCMGAAWPMAVQSFATGRSDHGRVGVLYAANSLGAVAGTLSTVLLLVPAFGFRGASFLAAAVNLAVAALAWNWGGAPPGGPVGSLRSPGGAVPRPVMAAAFLAGVSAFALESVYTRLLAMVVGGSTHAFAFMLAAFLAGVGGGAWVVSRDMGLDRRRDARLAVQVLAGGALAVLLGGPVLNRMPEAFVGAFFLLENAGVRPESFHFPLQAALSLVALLPPAFLSGCLFPVLVRLAAEPGGTATGRSAGVVYAANTLGCVAGALAAPFLLIPHVGMAGTLGLAASSLLAGALSFTWGDPGIPRVARAGLAAALVAVPLLGWPTLDMRALSAGVFFHVRHLSNALAPGEVLRQRIGSGKVLFHRDGPAATVTVEREDSSSGSRFLSVNGKPDASSGADLPTQVLAAHLPWAWATSGRYPVRRVALVGLASGMTAGSLLRHPLDRLDVIEIEPAMREASRFFEDVNGWPLADPRCRLIVDDARHRLRLSPGAYDLVVSVPSNPWVAGQALLFTKEAFEAGRSALAPGGVFAQWVQYYSLGTGDLRRILATFAAVFPDHACFSVPGFSDLFLVGSDRERRLDREAASALFRTPAVREDLARARVHDEERVLDSLELTREEYGRFATGGGLNTDDNASVEFSAPRSLYVLTEGANLEAIRSFRTRPLRGRPAASGREL